jgi:hypothetical protein
MSDISRDLLGKAHNSNIDNMSVAQMRVVLEHLLYTMEIKQRRNLMDSFPGLYNMIYPKEK